MTVFGGIPMSPDIDLDAVQAWMDAAGLGSGPIEHAEALTGGTQNLMASFVRSDRRYVLRRGPSHLRRGSNAAISREIELLGALGRTDVPHARLVAGCEDDGVLAGAAFYLMEPIDGYNPAESAPRGYAETPATRHRLGLSAVEALARVGEADHDRAGLADFGRPEGFLDRQVPRWLSELESYHRLDGYPGPDIGDVARVARWLDQHRPAAWTPGIMHGDFHMSNVMASHDRPEIVAIVDWEMATIGDPLLDLGWMLSLWAGPGDDADVSGSLYSRGGGHPTEQEIVDHYARCSSRDVAAIDWYVVLACFKLGIVLEGTYARSLAGLAPGDTGVRLHGMACRLLERATRMIAS